MIDKLLNKYHDKNLFDNFLERYAATKDSKVIVFGVGDQGMLNTLLLREKGVQIYAFCDNDEAKWGTIVKDAPVISPAELKKLLPNLFVINNDSYRESKKAQLLELGIPEQCICTFDVFNPVFKNFTKEYIGDNKAEFDAVYECLEDDFSRKTYIGYLSSVITGDIEYYKDIAVKGEYFPKDIVPIRDDHVFLDVGAYNGNTIEEFIEHFPKYDKIYAFEPFASSAELIKEKHFPNTEIHVAAAYDQTGEKTFYCNNYGAIAMITTILEEGADREELILKTEAIDDVIGSEKATFIKMDIEGSELAALHGAEHTIKNNKPFLAICLYHKREDFITIVPYLKKLVPEYKFYLRHHSPTGCDLVLYCVYDGEKK